MKMHPLFYVSLLELYKESIIPSQLQAPPPTIKIDGEEEFEVYEILDFCINWKKLEYLVHWQGYKISKKTWEPAVNLIKSLKMIQEFHCQFPYKPSIKNI